MKQKILFRADAGQSIGYGHFIRTLALADMLKEDFDCVFCTQEPTEYQVGEMEKVCRYMALPADDSKFQLFLDALKGDEIVVLDNYFYTTDYQKEIKSKGCKLVCIDDMHDMHYVADVVVNHGFAKVCDFSKESYTKLCLGPQYALLRLPFLNSTESKERDYNWMVCFGGSDENNFTGKTIERLLVKEPPKGIVAVVGDAYRYREELEKKGVAVRSRQSAPQMADLFRSASNVVCSASSVCYEAMACGCKVFAGYYVDNQQDFYENLAKRQCIIPLGNLNENRFELLFTAPNEELKPLFIGNVRLNFRALFYSLVLRMVSYPEMTDEESGAVWKVRNLPEIRQVMTNPNPFSLESHRGFVEQLKNDQNKLFLAFFDGKNFVGSLDFVEMGIDSSAERGLFISPNYQGRRLAQVLEKLAEEVAKQYGVRYLVAKVKNDNQSSLRFHRMAGYTEVNKKDEYIYFKRNIVENGNN